MLNQSRATRMNQETCAEPGAWDTEFERGEPVGKKFHVGCGEPVEVELLMAYPATTVQQAAGREVTLTPVGFCARHAEERLLRDPQAVKKVHSREDKIVAAANDPARIDAIPPTKEQHQ